VETWAGEISSPRCVIAGGGGGGRRQRCAEEEETSPGWEGGKRGGTKGGERERSARASHEVLDGGECYGGCPKIEFAGKRGAFD